MTFGPLGSITSAAGTTTGNRVILTSNPTMTSTAGVWQLWVAHEVERAMTATASTWTGWVTTGGGYNAAGVILQPTVEETRRWQAAQREADDAMRAHIRAVARAKERAEVLLQEHLDEQQRASLAANGYFDLTVFGQDRTPRSYRIKRGTHGNVHRIERGKLVKRYCIQPNGVPEADAMLAQKLLLETDEAAFLRIANAT